ncbi:MAG: hypothetical protein ABSE73_31875, partial [Planctomycetota bacterium]
MSGQASDSQVRRLFCEQCGADAQQAPPFDALLAAAERRTQRQPRTTAWRHAAAAVVLLLACGGLLLSSRGQQCRTQQLIAAKVERFAESPGRVGNLPHTQEDSSAPALDTLQYPTDSLL